MAPKMAEVIRGWFCGINLPFGICNKGAIRDKCMTFGRLGRRTNILKQIWRFEADMGYRAAALKGFNFNSTCMLKKLIIRYDRRYKNISNLSRIMYRNLGQHLMILQEIPVLCSQYLWVVLRTTPKTRMASTVRLVFVAIRDVNGEDHCGWTESDR